MKKLVLFLITAFVFSSAFSQQRFNFKTEHKKGVDVVCPARFVDEPSFVDMPEIVKQKLANKNLRTSQGQSATINVKYEGFPDNAKAAFERAVDIWRNLLVSTVPIKVTAYWEELDPGVLGAANTNDYYRNFPGAREVNTYYPLALAEKLAGRDLNGVDEDDIYCTFNSKMPWYFGTDPNVPLGTFDFTSIVLHELGHGLGFVGSMRVSGQQGYYGFGTPYSTIYDKFLETGERKGLTDTLNFKSPSNLLRNALVSEDIFFSGPNTISDVKEDKVLIYAPNPWESGSSISHLDDAKYGTGGINSLMTPTASLREKNLNPGPIALKMFQDMGWKSTSIVHNEIKNIAAARKVRFETKILSDTTLLENSAKLNYVLNGSASSSAKSVVLQKDGASGKYFADVDLPANTTLVEYFFEVKDNYGLTTTSPGNGGFENTNYIYGFEVGNKDQFGPVIEHYAPQILPSSTPVSLIANVIDDFEEGIDTVYVEYSVNGTKMPSLGLRKYIAGVDNKVFSQGRADDVSYFAENGIKNLKSGDLVKYQVIAIDKSKNKTVLPTYYASTNRNDKPTESFYEFLITDISNSTVNEYSSDFESNAEDFAMLGFSVAKPDGFPSNSLNSSHPYLNGLGLLDPTDPNNTSVYMSFERNEIAMLKKPILLKSSGATITFDEVALVEPGDAGSGFGDNTFYDFVVVEGSLDGSYWFPLQDGYDSRANSVWQNAFESELSAGDIPNSNAKGTFAMTKKRTVQIYGSDFTSDYAGSALLVRFRLNADQWATGWGWSIDNLYIQKEAPVILANENIEIPGLKVFPNPTQEYLNITLEVGESQDVKVEVFSLRGKKMVDQMVPTDGTKLDYQIALGNFSPGTYMVKLTEKTGSVVKKFIKN
ncbi:T9SS C-terminal target domain-containing protein [Lacihabitans sp. LS3-19]|uniref:T9SS type A sorting domain-containing protein n=1 Tax=Lacihabitans sp. LS3-19 TaxID=2487335 RepID=UPI0020CEE4E8|nr:T9SS type A sorting domain-containing protein [Lacihabitans sp. LS3-19]MCP9768507.1 T9SS C-terminal target domain-containing protein [Lacihabitans sp. LS3-19]